MTRLSILGVDPGLSGALCLYSPESIVIFDVPVIEVRVGKSTKRRVDGYQLGNWLDLHRNTIAFAMVEDVHSMPAQGIASAFSFGFTAGKIQGAIEANQIPMKLAQPAAWKARFGLLKQTKDASRLAASKIAPKWAHLWPLKKHDGRAESLLLAVYGSLLDVPANFGGTD